MTDTNAVDDQDIIPPHGFIHKPSPLWPPRPKPESGYTRVVPTKTNPPPQPGHADTLKPSAEEVASRVEQEAQQASECGENVHASDLQDDPKEVPSQKEMLAESESTAGGSTSPKGPTRLGMKQDSEVNDADIDYWEPKPPKVLMEDPSARPWELRAQIQLYATTEYVVGQFCCLQ